MNLLEGADQTTERDEILNKWKDKPLEEVLKAKVESDLYIKTLERQKDELKDDYLKTREELLAKAKFEELIDRFEKAPKESSEPAKIESLNTFDPKEVEDMISRKIQETKVYEREVENFNKVEKKLQERFGENYKSILKEQQSTLGLSNDDVNALAKKSPEAFFRMLGLNDQPKRESFQTPPTSNQRNDTFAPRGPAKRDYAFYQEMKKTNPKAYLDPKIAVQMHNDVMEMGETAFYGNA